MQLSGAQLKYICPALTLSEACNIADLLNQIMPLYGITFPNAITYFIANVAEESGQFKTLTESLNYSTSQLRKVFGKHRITDEQIERYGRKAGQKADQKALANILYGGNFGRTQLGNIQPSDGWNLRGSGLIQITGRGNMTLYTSYYNNKYGTKYTIEQIAELMRTDMKTAIDSACWFFAIHKGLLSLCEQGDFAEVVRRINGGLMNYEKRKMYYERAKLAV